MESTAQQAQETPLSFNVIVSQRNGTPRIDLRREITDVKLLKQIISLAYHDQPGVVFFQFPNKIRSLAALQEKGVISFDGEQYQFLI
jgi:hypothetical protein